MPRWDDETLSDNTSIRYCKQCKKCVYWGNGADPFSNQYTKGNCDMFPMPGSKPDFVINNNGRCPFRKERSGAV